MAHLKKSSSTGHLLKNTAGHLVHTCPDSGAPCSCPCASWPGAYPWDAADEPCGGLYDEYEIDNNLTGPIDGAAVFIYFVNEDAGDGDVRYNEYRLTTKETVTARYECEWVNLDSSLVESRVEYGDGTVAAWNSFNSYEFEFDLNATACQWEEYDNTIGGTIPKTTGNTPAGIYYREIFDSGVVYEEKYFGLIVTEPAP